MLKRWIGWASAATWLWIAAVGSVDGATVTLSQLLQPGATLETGGKTFSKFTYVKTGDMPAAEDVNVVEIPDGIRFQGGFRDNVGGTNSDALITYEVSASVAFASAVLAANNAVFDVGTGVASVTETFLPDVTNDKMLVFDMGGNDDLLLDTITFPQPLLTLRVQKDIQLHATGAAGGVTMGFVDQTFAQVPEPSTLVLLLGSLLGLAGCRRRWL